MFLWFISSIFEINQSPYKNGVLKIDKIYLLLVTALTGVLVYFLYFLAKHYVYKSLKLYKKVCKIFLAIKHSLHQLKLRKEEIKTKIAYYIFKSYTDMHTKPRNIIVTIISILFIQMILIYNISYVNENLKICLKFLVALTIFIIFIRMIVKMARDKSIAFKFQSFYMLLLIIVSFASSTISGFGNASYTTETFIVIFLLFSTIVFITTNLSVKYYHENLALVIVFCLYFSFLVVGAISFGEFYLNHFPDNFANQIKQLSNNTDPWQLITICGKIGIRGFFEFPQQEMLNLVTFFQFIVGKITELVLLGYFAVQILSYHKEEKDKK